MKKILFYTLGVQLTMLATTAMAHDRHVEARPNDHAPIGVMGDHNHKAGEWMLSYRYSTMRMEGNLSGTSSISDEEIAAEGFMISPQDMRMEMHMVGAMYGYSDKLTLMAMLPYKEITMDHKFVSGMHSGKSFKMRAEGIADVKLSGIYSLKKWGENQLYLNFGVSLPTGSIDKRDVNSVTGALTKLPYPMQIGAGTYDLLPGLTYAGHQEYWSWGAQVATTLRLNENTDEYRLGNVYKLSAWGARRFNQWFSTSLRLDGKQWGDIKGSDPELSNIAMSPTFRTDLRGGKRIDGILGVNFIVPHGELAGNRLAVEFGLPLYQDLDGPQLETDYRLMIGWQKAF